MGSATPAEYVSPAPDSRNGDVAEVMLLLPMEQLAALEGLARGYGLTVGQLLRRHVAALLDHDPAPRPAPTARPQPATEPARV